jgi:hypothetical protein
MYKKKLKEKDDKLIEKENSILQLRKENKNYRKSYSQLSHLEMNFENSEFLEKIKNYFGIEIVNYAVLVEYLRIKNVFINIDIDFKIKIELVLDINREKDKFILEKIKKTRKDNGYFFKTTSENNLVYVLLTKKSANDFTSALEDSCHFMISCLYLEKYS